MPWVEYRVDNCVWCNRRMQIRGRGMCGNCYKNHRDEVPMVYEVRQDTIMELHGQHVHPEEIASRLSLHVETIRRRIRKGVNST